MTYQVEQFIQTKHDKNDPLGTKDEYEWILVDDDFQSFADAADMARLHPEYINDSHHSNMRVCKNNKAWTI